jgi:hypothetical protein
MAKKKSKKEKISRDEITVLERLKVSHPKSYRQVIGLAHSLVDAPVKAKE